ncbi:MAG: nucleoid-associated protein [Olsenella sp.]|nr:nucleoid-associated protein [Olsenella sp.]
MMRISHAILHAFDFESGSYYFSERELDVSERATKSYVQRHMRKISSSADNQHGSFSEGSGFADALHGYVAGQIGFVEISEQVAQYLWEELRRCDDLEECDLLVCDFTDTKDMKVRAEQAGSGAVAEAMVEAAQDADGFDDLSQEFFAAVLLPRKQAFVHELGSDATGAAANGILRQDSTLPNPTQKVDSYVIVDLADFSIDFHDKVRTVGTEERRVIPDGLLQCSVEASSREVVETVEKIVADVAAEYGANVTEAVAQAKAVVASSADREESFAPEEVGREVFEDRPEMRERFEEAARERDLPEEVPVKRGVANRLAKNHKIKTDTGIEITFPSQYAADSNYIEFTTDSEGYVSIVIKNVGKIENK